MKIRNKIIYLAIISGILFLPSFSYAKNLKRKYYEAAQEYNSQGQDYYLKDWFWKAYEYYDEAITAAETSKRFENLTVSERENMDFIIRECRNQKFRILEMAGTFSELIKEHKIAKGMSKEQVKASWGTPVDIERKIYKWEELEVWHYGNVINSNDKYVYFKDNWVVDWEERGK
jgi:hypothetical protein